MSFISALTRGTTAVYGTLQEPPLEELPGAIHACKIVTSDYPAIQKLDDASQVGIDFESADATCPSCV